MFTLWNAITLSAARQWENEVWEDVIDEVVADASVNDWEVEQPLQFDFRLGNLCNLQCQMCNKEASHLVSVERATMVQSGLGANHPDWHCQHCRQEAGSSSTWNRLGEL